MEMFRRPTLALPVLLFAGCGYPGDPLPPALNIPERIGDLRAAQRGGHVVAQFTPTLQSTDGLILKSLSAIDLRGGPSNEGEFNLDAWAAAARQVSVDETGPEPITVAAPIGDWVGREIVLGVRAIGPTRRASHWSNLVVLTIVSPPARPERLMAEAAPQGVRLRWQQDGATPGASWRVFRHIEGETEYALLGKAAEPEWLDRTAAFGARYTYAVQYLVPAGEGEAESVPSEPVTITRVDTFAPAAPAGLTVIAGVNSVELSWERNAEPDLASYQVWRAGNSEPLARLGEPREMPSFSDTQVESGKRYRYAVSALDESGNESAPCAPVEITAP